MRKIIINCYEDGSAEVSARTVQFEGENDSIEVKVVYPDGYEDYVKALDIKTANDEVFTTEDSDFIIPAEVLVNGNLYLQPKATKILKVQKWETVEVLVYPSLNGVTKLPPASEVVEMLLELIDTKADKKDTYTKEEVLLLLEQKLSVADFDGFLAEDFTALSERVNQDGLLIEEAKNLIDVLTTLKADKDTVYTKEEVDDLLSNLDPGGGGGGTTDAYTKSETDGLLLNKLNKVIFESFITDQFDELVLLVNKLSGEVDSKVSLEELEGSEGPETEFIIPTQEDFIPGTDDGSGKPYVTALDINTITGLIKVTLKVPGVSEITDVVSTNGNTGENVSNHTDANGVVSFYYLIDNDNDVGTTYYYRTAVAGVLEGYVQRWEIDGLDTIKENVNQLSESVSELTIDVESLKYDVVKRSELYSGYNIVDEAILNSSFEETPNDTIYFTYLKLENGVLDFSVTGTPWSDYIILDYNHSELYRGNLGESGVDNASIPDVVISTGSTLLLGIPYDGILEGYVTQFDVEALLDERGYANDIGDLTNRLNVVEGNYVNDERYNSDQQALYATLEDRPTSFEVGTMIDERGYSTSINGLTNRLNGVEENYVTNERYNSDIQALTDRISALEEKIDTLVANGKPTEE